MSINEHTSIDTLVKEGRYEEAAHRSSEAGDFARAAELFERIWDFASAARNAKDANDLPRALRNALEAKDSALIEEYAEALQEHADGKREAIEVFAGRRYFARAALLAEELGDLDSAVEYYKRGHLDLDAARILVALNRDRDAGRLLERYIQNLDATPERAQANLLLGKILARLMQHENAVRCLQDATRDESTSDEARRALVVELAALGLRDAAREVHLSLRADHSELGADLDQFIREARPALTPASHDRLRVVGGRYRLEKLLGSGGSGRVYRASDEVSQKTVAVKLLSSTRARGDQAYERFEREAQVTTSLRHPNLVEVYDVSADLGFLVMEHMRGGSLDDRIKRDGRLPAPLLRRLGLDVLSGLELAHQRGIIHRDVKPANVFFDARGTAKLGDFGVAHLLDLGQTQTGGLIGTLAYMSPEQITGAPLTIAADLYGLGVTLFEALTGRLPFQGPDFVAQHLGETAPTPSSIAASYEPWDPIFARLLAKNPAERYDSIQTLRRDMQSLDFSETNNPLLMPRSTEAPSSESSISLPVATADFADTTESEAVRYSFESPLGKTERSILSRALDTVLNRSVILERFNERLPEEDENRLYALARGGGPFLQRALSYDREGAIAVFEAPAGSPMHEFDEAISTRLAVRLFKRLARAVAALHSHDRAHGSIEGRFVLLDERGHPTILVSGLPALGAFEPQAKDDAEALIAIVARAIQAEPNAEALVRQLVPEAPSAMRDQLLGMPRTDGEELHAFASAIELVLLENKQGGTHHVA